MADKKASSAADKEEKKQHVVNPKTERKWKKIISSPKS